MKRIIQVSWLFWHTWTVFGLPPRGTRRESRTLLPQVSVWTVYISQFGHLKIITSETLIFLIELFVF